MQSTVNLVARYDFCTTFGITPEKRYDSIWRDPAQECSGVAQF